MLKRFAALIFVFILAGQVLAGVCVCFDGGEDSHAKMSCCQHEKSAHKSVSARACCDAPCDETSHNKLPRSQSESKIQIPAPVLTAVEKLLNSLERRPNYAALPAIPKRAGDAPLRLSHPPNLYLQNHAFLI